MRRSFNDLVLRTGHFSGMTFDLKLVGWEEVEIESDGLDRLLLGFCLLLFLQFPEKGSQAFLKLLRKMILTAKVQVKA